jgi:hypothetical protein
LLPQIEKARISTLRKNKRCGKYASTEVRQRARVEQNKMAGQNSLFGSAPYL